MTAHKSELPARAGSSTPGDRVRTVISCPGVHPMSRADLHDGAASGANENAWFDPIRRRRHWYANLATLTFAALLLFGGVWIVTEFVRLQKIAACFEAGRRDCSAAELSHRQIELPSVARR